MVTMSEQMAQGTPFVRVDFYGREKDYYLANLHPI